MDQPDPLAVSTPIYFHVLYTNLAGTASVRYSTYTDAKHVIGIAFGTVSW